MVCSAVPGKVLEATDIGISRIAKVEFGGVTRQVYLDFVPEVRPGDYVFLAHVGFAISRVEPEEAERTYELLRQMAEAAPAAKPMTSLRAKNEERTWPLPSRAPSLKSSNITADSATNSPAKPSPAHCPWGRMRRSARPLDSIRSR